MSAYLKDNPVFKAVGKQLSRLGLGLLCLVLLIRLITLSFYPLIDPTESRYAEMARKMLETGIWVTPQIGYGIPFWGKPPLAVWLNAISLGIFGVNEFAARLSALVLCVGTVWIVYRLASARVEKDQAFVAPAVLVGMTLFFIMAGSVAMDQCLTLGVTLALGSFWQDRKSVV
jgi:4-amino-4-deoxy-L-arabinose transferase-like glycosyltransferase